jgi:hypothetical protein
MNPLHRKIVDQITAVDNFMAFKKLMVKRNTELNEQAMKMINGEADPKQTLAAGGKPTPSQEKKAPPHVTKEMIEAHKKAEEDLLKQAMEASLRLEQDMQQQMQ